MLRNIIYLSLVLCLGPVCSFAQKTADEPVVVRQISGREFLGLGEKQSGKVHFSSIKKPHKVQLRWVDTKGRVCGVLEKNIAPPQTSLYYEMPIKNPVGYNHRIEVLIDGKMQPFSHFFTVVKPYTPWIDYESIVWAGYDTAHANLLRKAGFSGIVATGYREVSDADFTFYPDNMCYEVFAYYHKRRPEHAVMKEVWAHNPNSRKLAHRRPSLTDEGTWEKVRDRLIPEVEKAKYFRPVFYNMADEIGIADQSATSDLDWEYSSRSAWREWCRRKYGTLDNLNKQWGKAFSRWGTGFSQWGNVKGFFPSTHHLYDQLWEQHLLPKSFGTIEKFNKEFKTQYKSFYDVIAAYRAIRSDDQRMTSKGLEQRFGKIKNLNSRMKTDFSDFKEAGAYIESFEKWVANQSAEDTRNWNLSWWCDWREYMDDYMANGLGRAREIGKKIDPDGRFGITGTHHPGVFNGHNYAKLMKKLDVIIPYNIGSSFEILRGLDPDFLFMHPTWQQGDALKRDLWYHFLHGCRGVLLWDNQENQHKLIDTAKGCLTKRGLASGPTLKEIRSGTDRMLLQSKREHDGIAVYYSTRSMRINWMHQFISLGRQWIKRESWHEFKQDLRNALRTSWLKVIEDNHLQSIFITPEQMAAGRLVKEKIKVLILPETWSLSKIEAQQIQTFVKNGGTLIADQYTGLYDGIGKRRNAGILDDLFGIDQSAIFGDARTCKKLQNGSDPFDKLRTGKQNPTRPEGVKMEGRACRVRSFKIGSLKVINKVSDNIKAGEDLESIATRGILARGLKVVGNVQYGAGSADDVALVSRDFGKGKAIFLNFDLSLYTAVRISDPVKTEKIVSLIRSVLPKDLQPVAKIINKETGKRQPGTEIGVWSAGVHRKNLAIWRNYPHGAEDFGDRLAKFDMTVFETNPDIDIILDKDYYVINQRNGQDYGKTKKISLKLSPWEPVILTLQNIPFEDAKIADAPEEVKLGDVLSMKIEGATNIDQDLQVFHVDVLDPNGKVLWYYSQDLSGKGNLFEYKLPFAMNDLTGVWTIKIREVATKKVMEHKVKVSK